MKDGRLNLGQVEAIVNKLGGMEGVQQFLRGEITTSKPFCAWREQDGVIYFSVTSDGATDEECITRLEGKGFRISDYAKSILHPSNFKPTDGVKTKVTYLIREKFTDEEIEAMGLRGIVAMSEPIKDSNGDPNLLYADRNDGGRWLYAYYDYPDYRWYREYGFAFAVYKHV